LDGATIRVKGNVKDFSGVVPNKHFLSIDLVEEYFTDERILITEAAIDEHGNFDATFDLKRVGLVILDFGKVERSMHCVPGKSYFINVRAPFLSLTKNHGYFAKDVRIAEISNQDKTELNYLINKLDQRCSDFLYDNWAGRKSFATTKVFLDSLDTEYGSIESKYFQDHFFYKKGEIMMYFERNKRDEFAYKYFESRPESIETLQGYQLFDSFYKGHFNNDVILQNERAVAKAMFNRDIDALLSLCYHPRGTNARKIQEALLLKGIRDIGHLNLFRKDVLTQVLEKIEQTSQFSYNKIVARNIRVSLNHLEEGYPAPRLVVHNHNGVFDIQDDRMQYVYLCFFKSWDETIVPELKVMNYLQKRFEDQLKVVCISTDVDTSYFQALRANFKSKELEFELYHYDFDIDILLNYRIKDFRLDRYDEQTTQKYFLISPSGKLIFSPAVRPSKGFEYDFRKLIAP
jgi:hypothetical protein